MNRLNKYFEEFFDINISDISETELLKDIMDWDSLKQVELVVGIQSKFNIDLSRDEIKNLNSIAEIRNILANRGITD